MIRYGKLGLFALLLNLMYLSSFASIMGSDIAWTCLGGDSFLIKISVYNDCNGSAMGNLSVNFKCETTGTTITTLSLTAPTPVDITPFCTTSCSRCQSSSCTFPYGISRYIYQGIVKLSSAGSCCNIRMSITYGTRSSSITTGAAGAAFYNEAMMNRCQNPCDNSPIFTNAPVQILCAGLDAIYNHGAKDSDTSSSGALSDSLTYELAQPMSAESTNISYNGSYTYNKPVYFWGFPNDALPSPRGIHFDPQNGDIQFRPMKTEVTVMVLKVNVFRNGTKIAELRRDLEFRIISCGNIYPPILTTPNNIRSKTVCAGQTVTFNFTTTDQDTSDTVIISYNDAVPGTVWTNTNGLVKHPTGTLTWTPTFTQASSQPYTFTVTAKDNACPLNIQVTQGYQITVKPSPQANILTADSGCGVHWFFAQPFAGIAPTYSWQGQSFSFVPNTGDQVSHQFQPGLHPYTMKITAAGCTTTYNDSLQVDTFMIISLPPDTTVCLNSTISINASIINAIQPYTLKWGSGNDTFIGDTTSVKQIIITKDTTIWVRATYASFSCPWDEINIKVQRSRISLPDDTFFCRLNNVISPVNPNNLAAFRSFKWYKQGSSVVIDSDAWLNAFDTGLFSVVVIDTIGCSFTDSSRIHTNPVVIASANDTTICSGSFTNLKADSISGHSYMYKWQLNGTLLSSSKYLSVSPPDTTKYTLIATEFLNGKYCSAIHLVTVNVKPLPVIAFIPFNVNCEYTSPVLLDNFVTVNGIMGTEGLWSCLDNPALINTNSFLTNIAATNMNPGYKLVFSYTDTITGCFNSDTVLLQIYPNPPKPGITVTSDTSLCTGDSVKLSSTGTFDHYLWSTGSKLKSIVIRNAGSYTLVVSTIFGCTSDSSDPVNIIVHPIPPKPVISISPSDSFLECDQLNGFYYWYYLNYPIPDWQFVGNSSRRINPKLYCADCTFWVYYKDSFGCVSDTSDGYGFHNLSINNSGLPGFVFYPNPAHSLLLIENPGYEPANMIISDIFGRRLSQQKLLSGKNTISISALKPGIYILRLNDSFVYRLVVE